MAYQTLLVILGLSTKIIHSEFIKNSFSRDWLITTGDKIIHSKNFNRHNEFAFATCETPQKTCEITLVSAETLEFNSITCKFTFDSSFVSLASIVIPNADKRSDKLGLIWLGRTRMGYSSYVSFVNMKKCEKSESYPSDSEMRFLSSGEVLIYKYPIFTTIHAGRSTTERSISGFSFENGVYPDVKVSNLVVNHTWIGKLRPLEMNSTFGFFYIGTRDDDEATTKIAYMNITSQTITNLATILQSEVGLQVNPETSGAHDRYGLCWNVKQYKRIICTQLMSNGYAVIHKVTISLTQAADWIAVYNLVDDALVVATGVCSPLDRCDEFRVQKISATGKKSLRFKVDQLDLQCPAVDIFVDAVEDMDKQRICFNFVCLRKSNEEIFQRKVVGFLQYRRKCIGSTL